MWYFCFRFDQTVSSKKPACVQLKQMKLVGKKGDQTKECNPSSLSKDPKQISNTVKSSFE